MGVITKYIKNENFHTTLINFIYQFKCETRELAALTILCRLLSKTNRKYSEIDLFAREKMNRYIMSYEVMSQSINDLFFINVSLLIPSKDVVKEDYLENALNFCLDSIYDNNLENDILLEREKKLCIEIHLNNYKNIDFLAEKNMLNLIDEEGIINKSKFKDIDYLSRLTKEDIINCFNKYIKNIKPKIFINGNIDIEKTEKTISNYFEPLNLKDYKISKDYNYYYDKDIFIDKTEVSKFYQSIVYMVYCVRDYKEEDFYKLYLINMLLNNSSSDLLLKSLRKENNLVYHCGSSIMIRNGLLFVKAVTNANNIKLAKMIIESVINDIKQGKVNKENIDNIFHRLSLNIEREKDNFYITSSKVINDYFKTDIDSEKVLKILKNITLTDLMECANRLEIKCIYTLEGR